MIPVQMNPALRPLFGSLSLSVCLTATHPSLLVKFEFSPITAFSPLSPTHSDLFSSSVKCFAFPQSKKFIKVILL